MEINHVTQLPAPFQETVEKSVLLGVFPIKSAVELKQFLDLAVLFIFKKALLPIALLILSVRERKSDLIPGTWGYNGMLSALQFRRTLLK